MSECACVRACLWACVLGLPGTDKTDTLQLAALPLAHATAGEVCARVKVSAMLELAVGLELVVG